MGESYTSLNLYHPRKLGCNLPHYSIAFQWSPLTYVDAIGSICPVQYCRPVKDLLERDYHVLRLLRSSIFGLVISSSQLVHFHSLSVYSAIWKEQYVKTVWWIRQVEQNISVYRWTMPTDRRWDLSTESVSICKANFRLEDSIIHTKHSLCVVSYHM